MDAETLRDATFVWPMDSFTLQSFYRRVGQLEIMNKDFAKELARMMEDERSTRKFESYKLVTSVQTLNSQVEKQEEQLKKQEEQLKKQEEQLKKQEEQILSLTDKLEHVIGGIEMMEQQWLEKINKMEK